MIAYVPRSYDTQEEAQAYVDSVNPISDVNWIVIDGSTMPFTKGTAWVMRKWIAWPDTTPPEPTVPRPDNAANKARDVIASAVGQAVYEWDNERPDSTTVEIHITKSILAALDQAGLSIASKEDEPGDN